jgi:hypothetical protein
MLYSSHSLVLQLKHDFNAIAARLENDYSTTLTWLHKKKFEFPRLIYDSEKYDYSIENTELKNDSCSTTEVLETTNHPNQRLAYNYGFTMYESFPKMAILHVSMAGTATSEGSNHIGHRLSSWLSCNSHLRGHISTSSRWTSKQDFRWIVRCDWNCLTRLVYNDCGSRIQSFLQSFMPSFSTNDIGEQLVQLCLLVQCALIVVCSM